MSVEETAVVPLKRQFPHVDDISDWRAQQSLRLLWDRIFELTAQLDAARATVGDLVSASNAQETLLTEVDRKADQALALAQDTAREIEESTEIELPGGGDGGEGARGCGDAVTDGHQPIAGLTAYDAGMVVCGTAIEWAALTAATVDLPTREANAEELLLRMIWHLQQFGFTAGRQQNPSGAISKDKLTVIVDGTPRAYDVFFDWENYLVAMTTQMGETAPVHMVADPGTAD